MQFQKVIIFRRAECHAEKKASNDEIKDHPFYSGHCVFILYESGYPRCFQIHK